MEDEAGDLPSAIGTGRRFYYVCRPKQLSLPRPLLLRRCMLAGAFSFGPALRYSVRPMGGAERHRQHRLSTDYAATMIVITRMYE